MDSANSKKKKRRKSKKEIVEDEAQNIDTGLANNPAQGNLIVEEFKVEDEVRSSQTEMDTEPIENLAQGNVTGKRAKKRKRIARAEIEDGGNLTAMKSNIQDEALDIGPTKMGVGSTETSVQENVNIENPENTQSNGQSQVLVEGIDSEILVEGIDAGKRKKKKKRKKKAADVDDAQNEIEEGSAAIDKPKVRDELQMDACSTETLADGKVITETSKTEDEAQNLDQENVTGKRRKKQKKKKGKVDDEVHSERDTARLTENVTVESPKVQNEIQSIDQAYMDSGPAQNNAEGNVIRKKKPKKKKAKVKDELSGRMDTGSTENLTEVMDAGSTKNLIEGSVSCEIPQGEEGIVAAKRKKKPKKKKAENVMSLNGLSQVSNEIILDEENLTEGGVTCEIPKVQDEVQSIECSQGDEGIVAAKRKKKPKKKKAEEVMSLKGLSQVSNGFILDEENLTEGGVTCEIPKVQDDVQSIESPQGDGGIVAAKRKKKPKKKKAEKVMSLNGLSPVSNEIILDEENLTKGDVTCEIPKVQDEVQSIESPQRDEGNATVKRKKKPKKKKAAKAMSLNGLNNDIILDEAVTVKDVEVLCCRTVPFASPRRKLLVLDLNGLLADIVYNGAKHCQGDFRVYGRAVFRRPFYDDFLKFCFQNFYVGIWSSRTKKIIDSVVNYLLGDLKHKLVFCWDMTHSTKSGFNTLENRHKPLVCKELRKIWEQDDPSWPWKKGDYNESNTLLLDDSPYKALLNPSHTAIFPRPYEYSDENDNSLGPGGDLRVYLEGLVTAENVQTYVKEHPFGQMPINEQSISWEFYNQVINKMSKLVNDETPLSVVEA